MDTASLAMVYAVNSMEIKERHRPGEPVTHPGIYRVHHANHRPSHKSLVTASVFPACEVCGSAVSYGDELAMPAKTSRSIKRDPKHQG